VDSNFGKRKEKVLWPIYECNAHKKFAVKTQRSNGRSTDGTGSVRAAKSAAATGGQQKAGKLYNRLDSVVRFRDVAPLTTGNKDQIIPRADDIDDTPEDNLEADSDEEDLFNKDVFESMVYWQIEQSRKKGTQSLIDALAQKELRKQAVGQNTLANNYNTLKNDRKPAMLHKLKPTLGAKYPAGYLQNCFLFKDPVHPIWESYISEYLENTQSDLNEHITFNQFLTIPWRYGLPQYIIEFVVQLVGNREAVTKYFQRI
jgi:hypothetical protein